MSQPDDFVLDDAIRRSASGPVPPAVEQKLRTRLAGFRAKLAEERPSQMVGRVHRLRPPLWGLGALCAAVVALGIAAGLLFRPRKSFAETAAAVLQQSWIHVRSVRGQDEGEAWFSPTKGVRAMRESKRLRFEDYRLRVYYHYDPQEKVVYRGPLVRRSPVGDYGTMATALKVLLQQDRPPNQPLADLAFLGAEGDRIKVLDQSVHKVTEGGHAWIDYRLNVRDPESARPTAMWFRVDPLTKLLHFCRIASDEVRFDYPEKGPVDIYDLGALPTAEFVDRVPNGDITRILETLRVGRERMDNYRALLVQRYDGFEFPPWRGWLQVLYRKGNKFRWDWGWYPTGNVVESKHHEEGEDKGVWWYERGTQCRYSPMCIVNGSTQFTSNGKWVSDPDGSKHREIESVSRSEIRVDTGETSPLGWFLCPEFACRPPMGIGAPRTEPVIDLHPTEGPPGCILLTVRDASQKDRVNENGISTPDEWRYWLDPKRDYIVIRYDSFTRDPKGEVRIDVSVTTEGSARSPQGVWYATRIRRHVSGRPKADDEIKQFYVDFKVDLPDSLFEPPKPGRTH
jgi:hypothetical protein